MGDLFSLFPTADENMERPPCTFEVPNIVTPAEVKLALRGGKKGKSNTAPGPDGLTKQIWRCVPEERTGEGVPQGFVLGPLLWNVIYDWVLGSVLQPQTTLLCYVDDTFILSAASTPALAAWRATATAASVISRIQRLGLKISTSKTEAALFYSGVRNVEPITVSVLDQDILTMTTSIFQSSIINQVFINQVSWHYL